MIQVVVVAGLGREFEGAINVAPGCSWQSHPRKLRGSTLFVWNRPLSAARLFPALAFQPLAIRGNVVLCPIYWLGYVCSFFVRLVYATHIRRIVRRSRPCPRLISQLKGCGSGCLVVGLLVMPPPASWPPLIVSPRYSVASGPSSWSTVTSARRCLLHNRGQGRYAASTDAANPRGGIRSGHSQPPDRWSDAAGVGSAQGVEIRLDYARDVDDLFETVDILLAPATPWTAPLLGEATVLHGGETLPVRASLGLYTQPISFVGMPVVVVPIHSDGEMPAGVQIIAPRWREDRALGVAAALERAAITNAPIAKWASLETAA